MVLGRKREVLRKSGGVGRFFQLDRFGSYCFLQWRYKLRAMFCVVCTCFHMFPPVPGQQFVLVALLLQQFVRAEASASVCTVRHRQTNEEANGFAGDMAVKLSI